MNRETLYKVESLFKKYEIVNREPVHLDKTFLNIESYKIELATGETIYRDKLVKKGGVVACVVVPLLENNQTIMVVQPRVFAKRGVLMDFPAGYVEKDEEILSGAKRELEEETGYTSDDLSVLASYYQDEGASDCFIYIVLAKNAYKVKDLKLDEDEYLDPIILNMDDMDDLM